LRIEGHLRSRASPVRELWLEGAGAPQAIAVDDAGRFACDLALDLPPGPLELRLRAVLANGARPVAFARTVQVGGTNSPSLPHYFWTAAQKAVRAFREGRLPLSPRKWLRDLRLHWHDVQTEAPAIVARDERPRGEAKQAFAARRSDELDAFLGAGDRLIFSACDRPRVSVIVVIWNRAELLLGCLRALAPEREIELFLVDNASTDRTPALLSRIDGARILRNTENRGFLLAANQGATEARGEHLLFLNSDAELAPGALSAALATLESSPAIGAVGGKLVLPDRTLQEAGSIIWRDGSCSGYARGAPADDPLADFSRDVDFCSGAFLLTRRALFADLGGFDERFRPAYYEDADYCVRLWRAGHRVVYQPRAIAVHYEFASSPSRENAIAMQTERRGRFVEKHADWLRGQFPVGETLSARARSQAPRILLIDDRIPRARHGSGHPRAAALTRALVDLGGFVTVYPTTFPQSEPGERDELPPEVELVPGRGAAGLARFLEERAGYYQRILVSRPHNLALLRNALSRARGTAPLISYDAEAIFAEREAQELAVAGRAISDGEIARQIAAEVAAARGVSAVLAVSERDRAQFARVTRAITVGHALVATPTPRPFSDRAGLLFVGAFHTDVSPNSDAALWLAREILPRIRDLLDESVPLTLVGARPPPTVAALAGAGTTLLENVGDLGPLYDRARLFVAPTRFAAGLPYKIHHAAAHGLPVVATSLLANQLGWRDEIAIADGAEPFARAVAALYRDATAWQEKRELALSRVAQDCSPTSFRDALAAALDLPR
jgi:GT2 family glycosyltransferase